MNQPLLTESELNREKTDRKRAVFKLWFGLIFVLTALAFAGFVFAEQENRIVVFEEGRQWQVASDSPEVEEFTTSGTWEVPEDLSSVTIEVWGGGGGTGGPNNKKAIGGGGGGAYSKKTIDVTPGTEHSYVVGAGGNTAGGSGGDTYWEDDDSVTVALAKGGSGNEGEGTASGGQAGEGIGDVRHSGGTGAAIVSDSQGGGGGGGAGSSDDGDHGDGTSGGSATSDYGGAGGDGSDGAGAGGSGNIYGGGGGGSARFGGTGDTGTSGAQGFVRITYSFEPPGTPGTPTYDEITASTLKVEWTEPTEGGSAAYYELERADDDNGSPDTFSFAATTTELYYDDSGLSSNTSYWYRVKAVNPTGESDFSTSSAVLTLPDKPGIPTYTNISTSTLTVNWAAPTGGADYYELEKADDDNGSPDTFSFVATTTDTSYGDSGLTSDTTYWYRVRAVNEAGESEYSDESDVTTLDAPPGTPDPPTYSNITASSLRVNWTAPEEGGEVEYYELERADDDNGSPDTFSFAATTTELYYDDSGLAGSSVYWYRVKAINPLGESDFSAASSVSTAFATILKGNIRIKGGTILR